MIVRGTPFDPAVSCGVALLVELATAEDDHEDSALEEAMTEEIMAEELRLLLTAQSVRELEAEALVELDSAAEVGRGLGSPEPLVRLYGYGALEVDREELAEVGRGLGSPDPLEARDGIGALEVELDATVVGCGLGSPEPLLPTYGGGAFDSAMDEVAAGEGLGSPEPLARDG